MSAPVCFRDRLWVDGVKALAVLSVVVLHSSMSPPGTEDAPVALPLCGLDVCFVLSGFLTTMWCVERVFYTNSVSPLLFFTTRVRKIIPPVVTVILISCLVFALVATEEQLSTVQDTLFPESVAAFYFLIGSTQPTDWLVQETQDDPLDHLWPIILLVHIYAAHLLLCFIVHHSAIRIGEVFVWILVCVPLVLGIVFIVSVGATSLAIAIWYSFIPVFDFLAGAAVATVVWKLSQHQLGRQKRRDEASAHEDAEDPDGGGRGRRPPIDTALHSSATHVRWAMAAGDWMLSFTYEPVLLASFALATLLGSCFFALDRQMGWDAVAHAVACVSTAVFLFAEEWHHLLHVRSVPAAGERARPSSASPHYHEQVALQRAQRESDADADASSPSTGSPVVRNMPYVHLRLSSGAEHPVFLFVAQRAFLMYLWHWPLIVCGDLAGVLPAADAASVLPVLARTLIVVVGSLALAVLTDDLVIEPLSRIPIRSRKDQLRFVLGALAVAFVAIFIVVWYTAPGVVVVQDEQLEYEIDIQREEDEYMLHAIEQQKDHGPLVLLIGDEMADQLHETLSEVGADRGFEVAFFDIGQCPDARLLLYKYRTEKDCSDRLNAAVKEVERLKPFLVIVQTLHRDYPNWKKMAGFTELMGNGVIEFYKELMRHGAKLASLATWPNAPRGQKWDIKGCVQRLSSAELRQGTACQMAAQHGAFHNELGQKLSGWCSGKSCGWVELSDVVCPGGQCPGIFEDELGEKGWTYHSKWMPNGEYLRTLKQRIVEEFSKAGVALEVPQTA
eukprot:TRINITY_DN11666_c0_g1_i1.p1 TRINITY_DN11666_c0_g1~~TRINITY_DN11666_c0_g1_i1.p1  ORF type:complete len:818 (+),score=273.36 TRINITY_DN11666_c0_g1_i1:99-2456(+)